MIIIPDEVKQSVNYNPVQFLGKLSTIKRRIIPNGINTYKQVSGKNVSLAVIEGNDIGEVIVLKILHIDVQDIIV